MLRSRAVRMRAGSTTKRSYRWIVVVLALSPAIPLVYLLVRSRDEHPDSTHKSKSHGGSGSMDAGGRPLPTEKPLTYPTALESTHRVMWGDAEVPLHGIEPRYAPSGPGRVRCGETTCALDAKQVCCEGESGARCQDASAPCEKYAWIFHCDETADCAAGELCCFEKRAATCVGRACERESDQMCSSDEECESGKCNRGAQCASLSPGRLKLPGPQTP